MTTTTTQHSIDGYGILSEEQIAQIVARVLAVLSERQAVSLQQIREAEIAKLRAFEDMHDLPHSIPTRRERLLDRGGRDTLIGSHRGRNGAGRDKEP